MRLTRPFYVRPTLKLSPQLLGKFLVTETAHRQRVGMIVEVEAYVGPHDLASHASRGRTPRTAVMFGPGGYWYVYLIYGRYYCLNIVTEAPGYPAAILIRAVEPISGIPPNQKTNGPGKLCQAFGVDTTLNETPATGPRARLWIEDRGVVISARQIKRAPRIGVEYAGAYKTKPWRFYLKDNQFVSKL